MSKPETPTREEARKRRLDAVQRWRVGGSRAWEELRVSAAEHDPVGYAQVSACVCDTTVLLETYTTEELQVIREFLCAATLRIQDQAHTLPARGRAELIQPLIFEGGLLLSYLDHLDEELRYRSLDDGIFDDNCQSPSEE